MISSGNLISREESTSVKGVAILLIILGHIGRDFSSLQFWLYSYHLILFFMLPFLYGKKEVSTTRLINTFLRLYIPYLWVLIMCLTISLLIGYTEPRTPTEYIKALLVGSQTALKESVGFNFPWFMPAFFFSSLFICIRDLSKRWSLVLTTIINLYGLSVLIYIAATSPNSVYILSCFSRGAAYFSLGYIACYFISRKQAQLHTSAYKFLSATLFILGVVSQAILQKNHTLLSQEDPLLYTLLYSLSEIWTPISALCLLYGFKEKLARQKFLRFTGRLSFEIYCFHVIVLNCLWKAADILGITSTAIASYVIFLLTCVISIGIAYALERIPYLHYLLFPRGIKRR